MQDLFNHKKVIIDNYELSYSQIRDNIHYILQVHLVKNLSLGNIYIDTIFHFTVLSIVIHFIINFKFIFNYIFLFFNKLFINKFNFKYKNIIVTNKSAKLFNSIKWYLSSIKYDHTNVNNHTELEYYYDNNLNIINKYLLSSNKTLNEKYIKIYEKNFILEFLSNNINLNDNSDIKLIFTKIKDEISIDNFFNNCIISYENYIKQDSNNYIYKNINNIWICDKINNYNFDSIILDSNLKYKIITDIQNFINYKNIFDSYNVLHKKSYLFYGPSGTGKSVCINAIAKHFKYNIYYLNIDNLSDENIIELLNNIIDPLCYAGSTFIKCSNLSSSS
jgi:hypothetical protein